MLLALRFMEITTVEVNRNVRDVAYSFMLSTVQGKTLQYTCSNCEDVVDILSHFLEGLKARSRYVVSLRNMAPDELSNAQFDNFEKGDLLTLSGTATDNLMSQSWATATNERTGEEGSVHSQNVYILPTLAKPDSKILKLFKMSETELSNLRKIFLI